MAGLPSYLKYHQQEHKKTLESYLFQKMDSTATKWLLDSIESTHSSKPDWEFKVTVQAGKPAIHIGISPSGKWSVIGWLDPCLKWVNLHLKTGTKVDDQRYNVSLQDPNGTPHSVNVKEVDRKCRASDIVELLEHSQRLL